MTTGWPDNWMGAVQVLETSEFKKVDGTSFVPPRLTLLISDGVHCAQVIAGRDLTRRMLEHALPPYSVVEIEGFEQMFVVGRTVKVVIVDKVTFLRQEQGVIGKPQRIVLPFEEGQGALGSNDHLAQGFPGQAPIPYPQGVDYAQNMVQQRTVPSPSHATGKIKGLKYETQMAGRLYGAGKLTLREGPPVRMGIRELGPILGEWYIIARISKMTPIQMVQHGKNMRERVMWTMHDEFAAIDGVAWDGFASKMARLEVGKLYQFSRIGLNRADLRYTRANHLYQVQIMERTTCVAVPDNDIIPAAFFEYRRLNTLEPLPANRLVDVVAIIVRVGEPMLGKTSKVARGGTKYNTPLENVDRVDVYLYDDSLVYVRLCAFGQPYMDQLQMREGQVVTIKGALIDQFRGSTSLKTQPGGTVLTFEPDNAAHVALKAWYDSPESLTHTARLITGTFSADGAPLLTMPHHINLLTIPQIRSRELGLKETPDIVKIRGTICFPDDKPYVYFACPDPACNKMARVAERTADGLLYICSNCDKVYASPSIKYRLNVILTDTTGTKHWITAFNGVTKNLFSLGASDMLAIALQPKNRDQFRESLRLLSSYRYMVTLQISTVTKGPYKGAENWIAVKIDWEGGQV
ncbi:hypothetical protein CALCODRAFT_486801 [Calocera cornea HHB12733]|uniref:Replication factor A C-terminal domain-containing protein n=1 Tax=Calocera cornea HHB12733 TaxID=1353952 RepID=A0A165DI79_9BASI|nr:hypothetical protein CALCODRAFT_486801 [Calocera cornea HHB12733]